MSILKDAHLRVSHKGITPLFSHTGNKNLWRKINVWQLCLSGDFDAIGNGGSAGEGPAATAKNGNKLIAFNCKMVDSVNVSHQK